MRTAFAAILAAVALAATGCASRPERVEPQPQPEQQPHRGVAGSTYTVPDDAAVRPIGQPREWDQPARDDRDDSSSVGEPQTQPAGPVDEPPVPPHDEPRDPFAGAPSWVALAYETQTAAVDSIERQAVVVHEFVRVGSLLRQRPLGWLEEAFDEQAEGMRALRVLPPEYAEPFAEVLELLGRALAAERDR